jgi:putative addiction module component (TIGR02574 family)
MTKEQIKSEAMHLEPSEREELAEELLLSIDGPDREAIDAAWLDEARRRDAAYAANRTHVRPVNEVLERLYKKANP